MKATIKNKVALIGVGKMGKFHLRVLNKLGILSAIMDVDDKVRKEINEKYGIPVFDNIKDLMKTNKPDAVVIATPTNLHFSIAKDLIGTYPFLKAILMEKPIAKEREEALKIKQLAKKHNVCIIVGHVEVYNPIVSRMIEIIKEDHLGKIRNISFQRRGAVSVSRLPSIGDIFEDLGVHDFDIAAKLLKGHVKLSCASLKKNSFHNTTTIIMDSSEQNIVCSFILSREYAGKKRQITVQGTKGTLIADLIAQTIKLRGLGKVIGDSISVSIPFKGGQLIKSFGEPLQEEILDLVKILKNPEKEPKVSIDDGINTLTIVEAARKSLSQENYIEVELI